MAALEAVGGDASVDWTRLSKASGVDFEALRAKYLPVSAGVQTDGARPADAPRASPEEAEKIRLANERMADIHACPVCHGSGLETYQYNWQQRQRNCTNCDGSGVIVRSLPGLSTTSQHEGEEQKKETSDTPAPEARAGGSSTDAVGEPVAIVEEEEEPNLGDGPPPLPM